MTTLNIKTITDNHYPDACPYCNYATGRWEHLDVCREKFVANTRKLERKKIVDNIVALINEGKTVDDIASFLLYIDVS